MKKSLFLLFFLVSICFCNCANANNDKSESKTIQSDLTKQYVDNNAFIDVNVNDLLDDTGKINSGENKEENAKMKVAVYRFYKNVTVEDGLYVCNVAKGEDINVSQDVFNVLYANLQEMNQFLKEAKEKGEDVVISRPDENYLNSLLID